MAFTMNKDRINLRGSADTPGSFSTDHTGKIDSAFFQIDDGTGGKPENKGLSKEQAYEKEQARTGNEPLRNPDGNVDSSSTTRPVNISQGAGGKSKGTETTRSVRRVKKETDPNASRYGAGRIGEEKTTRDKNNKIMQTRTVLAGTSGFNADGTIKNASVNSIKTKGTTTSSMPTADVLKKKKGSTMMYRSGKKH
tara:strand:+ start:70 stop:654 length:585 start_codon:yes stop_codon:yes gene_type:complete